MPPEAISELHCEASDSDEALASAAQALGMEGSSRRRGARTLVLAEVGAREADALSAAVGGAGLHPALVASPSNIELRKAFPLLLVVLLGRNGAAILGPSLERYGVGLPAQIGVAGVVAWGLCGLLLALLARRFLRTDVVPLWRRPASLPRPLDASAARLAAVAAIAAVLHALLGVYALVQSAPADLSSGRDLALIIGGDLLAIGAYGVLWLSLDARGGATGAARYLSMLVAAYAVDLAVTALASGRGLAAFPWYTVPILHLGAVVQSYPMLRALVLALLYLALGYALRRMADQTPTTRLMAGAALATGIAHAGLWSVAPAFLALFDLGLAALLLPRSAHQRRVAATR